MTGRGGEVRVPVSGEMAAEQDPEGRAAARPLLTDLYQATMALGYWRAGRAREPAEFELFFRRCPFGGAFALAAGLRDCLRFLHAFRLQDAGTPWPPPPRLQSHHPGSTLLPDESPSRAPTRPIRRDKTSPPRAPHCRTLAPTHAGLCRPQTCSSWPRCCRQTLTPRSSSISGVSTAPG